MRLRQVVTIAAVLALTSACTSSTGNSGQTLAANTSSSSSASPTPTTSSSSPTPTPSPSPTSSPTPTTSSSTTPTTPSPTPSAPPPPKPKPKPKPTDPLTGLAPSGNPVIAVKIDNTGAGFPQFGIGAADIVYVEQVEGGLTRLIGVFHTTLPTEVGAIRSMRSTDVELLPSYGKPILVASGGAYAQMKRLYDSVLLDATQQSGGPGYWRSSFGNGTHNLHVNLQQVAAAYPGKGKAQPMGFTFSPTDPRLGASARRTSVIDVTMLAGRIRFTYSGGRYLAYHFDTPYTDQHGNAVYTQNVVVQHVRDEPDGTVDSIGSPSYLSHTVGSGKFTLYRDGRAIDGTWSRASVSSPTKYLDAHGKPVPFKPGKTWVLLAPQTSVVNQG